MEIQYLEINQICEPVENISDYIKDFSEAATVLDVQCNAIPVIFENHNNELMVDDDSGIKVIAFIKYEDNKEATPEKKQWLKEFFDRHLDKETKLFIDSPFDKWSTKGDEVYEDTLRNCLFQQYCKTYTDKQIASIYKEWLLNH